MSKVKPMFEIEKKFILTGEQEKRLTEGAEFLGEKTFTDIYFDTAEYALTKNDIWLRSREGAFEVKLPMRKNSFGGTNQYNEIDGEEKIRQVFGIVPEKSFLEDIRSFGYAPFCQFKTTRKKYRKGKFTIDLDDVDFGDFRYSLAEIELMVTEEKGIPSANEEILKFAKSLDLKIENVRGKGTEYLLRKKPEHYRALVEAGVVIE
jgi:adenylate cyclase class IV